MAVAVFGRKSPLGGTSGARPAGWQAKAGPQQLAIVKRIHRYLLDAHQGTRGLQVRDMLAACGRLSGFAAQYVVWQKATGAVDPCVGAGNDTDREMTVATLLGRPHAFAHQVDGYLAPSPSPRSTLHGSSECVWSIAGEAVLAAGGRAMSDTDARDLVERARAVAGSADGDAGDAADALGRWAAVRGMLEGDSARGIEPLAPVYWPLALAEVARRAIADDRGAVEPMAALGVVMEAAARAAILDPKHVSGALDTSTMSESAAPRIRRAGA